MSNETKKPGPAEEVTVEAAGAEESESRRYWRVAISHLTDLQKRDAAWEFYLRKLEGRKVGDTFSGLVLLLEANGVFLSSLPERIQRDLMDPFADRLATMKGLISEHEACQRDMLQRLEEAAKRNQNTNTRAVTTIATAESALRKAATALDANSVVQEVKRQIEEQALLPFKRVLQDLATSSIHISEATGAAKTAVERWRRVHLSGVAAWMLAFVCVGIGGAAFWIHRVIKQDYEQRFIAAATQLDNTHEAFSKIAGLGIPVHAVRSRDTHGNVIKDSYEIKIDGVETADAEGPDGHKQAVVRLIVPELLPAKPSVTPDKLPKK